MRSLSLSLSLSLPVALPLSLSLAAAVVLLPACTGSAADRALDATGARDCDAVAFSELAVPCRTQAAVEAADRGDALAAAASCDALEAGLWKDECHFRVAEELGLGGHLVEAARGCAAAGRFRSFCFIHLAWWARPFPLELGPGDPGAGEAVAAALAELSPVLAQLSEDEAEMLRTSVWFDLYFGSGSADPGPARDAGSVQGRTAWAWEAVRLAPESSPQTLLAAWSGAGPAPTGASLAPSCWGGWIADPVPVVALSAIPRTAIVHGGTRLVGSTPDEDAAIALLEARWFHGRSSVAELQAALAAPDDRLRMTAARLLGRVAQPQDAALRAVVEGDDPVLAEAARAGARGARSEWAASEDCRP